ncbi:FecR domain-containing protein [Planctomycetales bacterium ZRK34]|nr:FecR domain-containing protein [Planctomycetales bacterium ZRK34]
MRNGKNMPPPPQSSAWGMIGPILAVLAVGMAIWVHSDPPDSVAMPHRDPNLDPSVYDAEGMSGSTAEAAIVTDAKPTKPATTARRVVDAHTPRLIASRDARWAPGVESPEADGPLPSGLLTLEEGRIEFALPSGVHITLEGHCVFETTSDNSIRLERGTLSADVPDEATGFFVQTPNARVTAIEDEAGEKSKAAPSKTGSTSNMLSPVELTSI